MILGGQGCIGNPQSVIKKEGSILVTPTVHAVEQTVQNSTIPTSSANNLVLTPEPTVVLTEPFAEVEPKTGFPNIANLWGMDDLETDPAIYAGFDLFVPYTFPSPADQAANLHRMNPSILLLHNQYATKGRPELAPMFAEWWDSQPGDPGYPCFLRDHRGTILLVKVWKHPMVNMTIPYCRSAMVQKNIDDFKTSSYINGTNSVYSGIYWDLIFDRITWLGDDIDSNGDGLPDNPEILNKGYREGVIDFLSQMRTQLPDIVLVGNETSLSYSPWMNGRLFEWQLSNLLDGADFLTWEEVIDEYRKWTVQTKLQPMTIIMSSPTAAFAEKYPGDALDQIPAEIMAEAEASYQRMRYGLTSALMGNGYFAFDFGPMIHGFPWWYDEYGASVGDSRSTLPKRGYLGQPAGDPYLLEGVQGVWARDFDHGLVIVNTTKDVNMMQLPDTYCKIKGNQAPLFKTIVDDDHASKVGNWKTQTARLDQFGETVQAVQDNGYSTITYTPSLAYSGTYEVYAWVSLSNEQSSTMRITIHNTQGMEEVLLNGQTGKLGWKSLGLFPFDAGNSESVVFHSGGDGITFADAIKWESTVRYNDGSMINQITLQPQDGIILIPCNP